MKHKSCDQEFFLNIKKLNNKVSLSLYNTFINKIHHRSSSSRIHGGLNEWGFCGMNQGEQRKSELPVLGRINKASREKEKGMSRCAILQGFGVMSGALPSAVGKERESTAMGCGSTCVWHSGVLLSRAVKAEQLSCHPCLCLPAPAKYPAGTSAFWSVSRSYVLLLTATHFPPSPLSQDWYMKIWLIFITLYKIKISKSLWRKLTHNASDNLVEVKLKILAQRWKKNGGKEKISVYLVTIFWHLRFLGWLVFDTFKHVNKWSLQ